MQEDAPFDAVVIGGGPAGSTAAHYLSKAGKRVVLLEKDPFPRFHIGESLLPYNRRIFDELGVWDTLVASGFPRKWGAQFHTSNGAQKAAFDFRAGRFNRYQDALQVERSRFDHLLLQASERAGTSVRQGWQVTRLSETKGGFGVECRRPDQTMESLRARFVVDASGRSNFSGNQEGAKIPHPRLRKLSIFGHFCGVRLDEGERAGDTVIIRLPEGWFWIIPIGGEKVSVGCVFEKAAFVPGSHAPAEAFWKRVESSSVLKERLARAELLGELQVTTDFSYRNRGLVRGRLVRVGDAAGFIDPIFSSGVFLAMDSARAAALGLLEALDRPDGSPGPVLQQYEKRLGQAMDFYLKMVEGFYTVPFMEVLLHPHPRWGLAAAVNAMLAGDVEAGWPIRWRLSIFLLLVRLQRHIPIAPKLQF